MRLDIIFDTICPWCFLGKHRLEEALRQKPNIRPEITWHAFLLNPNLAPEGVERKDYLSVQFGDETRSNRIYDAIYKAGKSLGIEFQFDLIERTPNSFDSHRLVRFANRNGCANEAVEALFQAYFIRGIDIGNRTALYDLAEEMGFEKDDVRNYFYGDEDIESIKEQNAYVRGLGVNGIPALLVDGQFSISGAQEPQVISRLLEVADERQRELFASGTQPL